MGNRTSTPPQDPTPLIPSDDLQRTLYFKCQLNSIEDWNELCHVSTDRMYARTTLVKAVVQHFLDPRDLNAPVDYLPNLYYLNSQAYLTHMPFCSIINRKLSEDKNIQLKEDGGGNFNQKNYKEFPRCFVLLTIVHYEDSDQYAVELWPGDNLPAQGVWEVHEMLRRSSFFGENLKWRAASPLHEQIFKNVDVENQFYEKKVLLNAQIFGDVTYQPLFLGECFGILQLWYNNSSTDSQNTIAKQVQNNIIHGDTRTELTPSFDKRTILVCEELPVDLNPIRGLVTQQLQTPLCHVALLCSSRGTPNMALKSAFEDLKSYEGKLVRLVVGHANYSIELASDSDESNWVKAIEDRKKSRLLTITPANFQYAELARIKDVKITREEVPLTEVELAIGSKAFNFADFLDWEVRKTVNTTNFLSFVIPFHYFMEYVNLVAYQEHSKLTDPNIPESEAVSLCVTIRAKILNGSIDPSSKINVHRDSIHVGSSGENGNSRLFELLNMVSNEIEAWKTVHNLPCTLWSTPDVISASTLYADGVIFRSSTNCEDIPGFPSAGLYHSEPSLSTEVKSYEKAILKVWSSFYSEKAYLERREFGIKEDVVGMAILVMPLLKQCVYANGVAVTANPFRSDLSGVYINTQIGTCPVTDSCKGNTPEQVLLIRDGFEEQTMEVISSSSLVAVGTHIITPAIAPVINIVMGQIHAASRRKHTPQTGTNASDVEFMILKDGRIVILQTRLVRVQIRMRK